MSHKALILSGGLGTRLFPCTPILSKQNMPIYDKPMIYYSLSTAMTAGIKDVLLISSNDHLHFFQRLFGDGSQLGMNIQYAAQAQARGLPDAFLVGEQFLNDSPAFLILGDNLFHGNDLSKILKREMQKKSGASIFTMHVNDPERYGVIFQNENTKKWELIEKPTSFVGNRAITGMYFFDNRVCEFTKTLQPSKRGEIEITDLIRIYLEKNDLSVVNFGRGMAWLDTGTPDALLQASQFVQVFEERQGQKIACIEEIALRNQWIDMNQFDRLISTYPNCKYKNYLYEVGKELLV